MRALSLMLIVWFFVGVTTPTPIAARFADQTMVWIVLFYSPNCSHCHYVMTEFLEPMLADYQDQLVIAQIDVSQPAGSKPYHAPVERYGIPSGRRGVPTLIFGDAVLVGSRKIPDRFPALVTGDLAAGGVFWSDIPGLVEQLAQVQSESALTVLSKSNTSSASIPTTGSRAADNPSSSSAPLPVVATLETGQDGVPTAQGQGLASDPLGFGLARVVLCVLI